MNTKQRERVVGIDLGTTNSVIAIVDPDDPEVLPNAEGKYLTPSIVAFNGSDTLVGDLAKRQAITNPENTIRSIKRQMGHDDWVFDHNGKRYIPQEVAARILMKLKGDAEAYLNEEVERAVVTVPAYFNNRQRQATTEAGRIAGLDVVRIVNEPTAAAVAYGYKERLDQTILVFDLGGGTFDVSVMEKRGDNYEVKATNGDTQLGGDDWDRVIIDWLVGGFRDRFGVDLNSDPSAQQRLFDAAETAKKELSTLAETNITLPFIAANTDGPLNLEETLTRHQFEKMSRHLLERCRAPFHDALQSSGLSLAEIDHVVLVGGSTRMPAVRELIHELTDKEPRQGINPDEAVADGAALNANSIVNPGQKSILLLDVTPLNLGVEIKGGSSNVMIERNSSVPVSAMEEFTTASDNQRTVEVNVLEGQREMAKDNVSLGKFQLTGIRPARRGVPKIEVTFSLNSNGILEVTALDRDSGRSENLLVEEPFKLTENEIAGMIEDARTHRQEDERKKFLGTQRNRAERILDSLETNLEYDYKQPPPHQMSAGLRASIHRVIADLNDALLGEQIDANVLDSHIRSAEELDAEYWAFQRSHS